MDLRCALQVMIIGGTASINMCYYFTLKTAKMNEKVWHQKCIEKIIFMMYFIMHKENKSHTCCRDINEKKFWDQILNLGNSDGN